jgi:hypothetical protein
MFVACDGQLVEQESLSPPSRRVDTSSLFMQMPEGKPRPASCFVVLPRRAPRQAAQLFG